MTNSLKPYPKGTGTKPTTSTGTGKPKPKGGKRSGFFSFILMALVKYAGNGAIGISGKIAGTVFTIGGQQGPFVRVWAKPRNRRTSFQTLTRGILSGISSSFRNLTGAQVDAWNASAQDDNPNSLRRNVFGDVRRLSGSQLYQRVNNILTTLGQALYTSPPTVGSTDSVTAAALTGAETGQALDLDLTTFAGATAVPTNTFLVVYATAQKGNGSSYFGASQYRLIGFFPATTAINPCDISAEYIARFGALNSGSRVGVKCHFVFNNAGVFSKGGDVYASATIAA